MWRRGSAAIFNSIDLSNNKSNCQQKQIIRMRKDCSKRHSLTIFFIEKFSLRSFQIAIQR